MSNFKNSIAKSEGFTFTEAESLIKRLICCCRCLISCQRLLQPRFVLPWLLILFSAPLLSWSAEPEIQEFQEYERREEHDPNGIGKFYMGREIAHVMGHQAAVWLERPERETEERLTRLVTLLELKPGMVVADIGAGSGVLSLRMAPKVLPEGEIIAVDIQREMLIRLQNRAARAKIMNVKPLMGQPQSPELEPESVDLVLMVDVYHEFEFPHEMMQNISQALKPGGRIALVEYRLEDPRVPIKLVHKMSERQAIEEMTRPEWNLEHTTTIDKLPRQHLLIFTRKD